MKSEAAAPVVEFRGVSKTYPGIRALHDVSLTLTPGTVTALAGENGAGKSTFIKLLSGAEKADSGRILLRGHDVPGTPGAVIDAGVSVIYQELTDVPDMSLLDNLVLGRQPARLGVVRRGAAKRAARAALERVGLAGLPLDRPVRRLSLAQRQLTEIARCLARDASVLVFDEPTSALSEKDTRVLLETIKSLRAQGMAILYVSHHLDELFEIADEIAVLRDGELVGAGPVGEWDEPRLVRTMLAKDMAHAYPWHDRPVGEDRLRVRELDAPGVKQATLQVKRGEIVGLVGLAGAGRTELLKAVAGLSRRSGGKVEVDGRPLPTRAHQVVRRGVIYAPEDRKAEGLVLDASVRDNLSYGVYRSFAHAGWVRRGQQDRLAREAIAGFRVKARDPSQPAGKLSGGNQQKIVLARAAAHTPKVLLLDDPTRGVDVGAKPGIHEHVLALAEYGAAVLMTSSDTDEVLAMADRVYVLRTGRVVGELRRAEFDRERVLRLAAAG
ncbi:sugar ABC transporter ATP-binding protein [Amycolatopsis rhabdoformis]|uniref:Sugar ABC transporter ATP-binding protein n=1 Tax=Amycolatopsis rhabdoformis TaxID=1448059 RepID=A0ABZ1IIQ3_9PSEU|nr:sugar ABC transporter ATP-binding protein [Amycolatopsis rhabdoformis]WSE33608.1 sugar ABC transporter ATP-binding protein [Amycolatopsis rhabdoformis]